MKYFLQIKLDQMILLTAQITVGKIIASVKLWLKLQILNNETEQNKMIKLTYILKI